MKIMINEKESYNIVLDNDEISSENFLILMSRLKDVEKMLLKFQDLINPNRENNNIIRVPRSHKLRKELIATREQSVEALKIHYCGSSKEKDALAYKLGINRQALSNNLLNRKKKYNIQPKEIGIVKFPPKGQHINVKKINKDGN